MRRGLFSFLLSLAVPAAVFSTDLDRAGRVTGFRMWTADGSWARIDDGVARQAGPLRVWDRVEEAYAWWLRNGRPERERFGATVTPAATTVWLERPDNPWPASPCPRQTSVRG